MTEARKRETWQPFSMFMALFANSKRNPKKKAFSFEDFYPFNNKKVTEDIPKAEITDLRFIFKDQNEIKNGVW